MKKLLALAVFLPLAGFAIEPVIFSLNETTTSYTVPAGRVLVIESINGTESAGMCRLNIGVGAEVHRWPVSLGSTGTLLQFARPLKIPEQSVLTVTLWGAPDESYTFLGVLATEADLYARIDGSPGDIEMRDGVLSFDVRAATGGPAAIVVEGSGDASEWRRVAATVNKTDARTYHVSVPVEDRERYFARFVIRRAN